MSIDVCASIVTYHSDIDQLSKAVESFYSTQCSTYLTIVDNASGEAYQKKLKAIQANIFQENTPELLYLTTNRGYGAGHNAAIAQSPACRYHLILNPDVVIHDGTLDALVNYMDVHTEVGAVIPKVLNPDGSVQYLNKRLPTVFTLFARRFLPQTIQKTSWVKRTLATYEMRDVGYENEQNLEFMSGCFMLIRKDVLDKIRGFDERFFMYFEDADLTHRINAISQARYVPDVTITHYWTRGAHHSRKLMLIMLRSAFSYFNKWGWKWW